MPMLSYQWSSPNSHASLQVSLAHKIPQANSAQRKACAWLDVDIREREASQERSSKKNDCKDVPAGQTELYKRLFAMQKCVRMRNGSQRSMCIAFGTEHLVLVLVQSMYQPLI